MDKQILLLISTILCHFSYTTSYICSSNPPCSCFDTKLSIVNCRNVQNVTDVIELLKSRSPIYRVRLKGNFTSMSSRIFNNVSVSVLWIESPLNLDIPNDSLLGIQNLKQMVLNNAQYQTIPKVFSNQYFTEFESSYGRLTAIETQLQNMSSATEIRLMKNLISSVFQDAFCGTSKLLLLDLSYNELIYIDPDTFEPLMYLQTIYLQHNHLQMLDGCLVGLNPKVIDLYGNNLTSIDKVLHDDMWNLKILNIGGNTHLEVSSHSFNRTLKSLIELHLSNNGYTNINPQLIKKLWGLHKLYLNGNEIANISRYFFENNPYLNVLQLSNNRLTSIEEAMRNRKFWNNWLTIALDGNHFKKIDFGKKILKIRSLDISRNRITQIKEIDMLALQRTIKLNLSHNGLTSLDRNTFRNLHSLLDLDLSYNHLKQLNYSLQELPKLNRIHLNSLSLERLTSDDFSGLNNLKDVYLRNNSLQTASGAFRYLENLKRLDLAGNSLTTLTVDSFSPTWNTSIEISEMWMADNPWICDCRLAWMASWVQKQSSKLKDEPICAAPDNLKNQTLRSLNQSDYMRWIDECPDVCECICQWDGIQVYTEVHCIRQDLNTIPKLFPINIRTLDLRLNNIEFFDSKQFLRLKDLEYVNLEHNSIREVQLSAFLPKLSSLRLAYNQLHTFPVSEWIAKKISVTKISLSYNPWVCNCKTWNFRTWLVQENRTIVDADQIRCGSKESTYFQNKLIISLTQDELCNFHLNGIILPICSALLLIFGLLCFFYRHSLIALFYSCGCACLKSANKHEYPYDVFLMYNVDEEQFVRGEIASVLENSKYSFHLCIPDRDIPSPRTQQKINTYLPQCSKVLVLLTRSFIENRECLMSLISAMSFSTASSKKCIIFVIKGLLPPAHELDPILRTLLRSCTCLTWGKCLFWQKLIYQLPKIRKNKQEWEDIEEEALLGSE